MTDIEIYVLNVGQADTSILKTPEGNVIVIDAVKPRKTRKLLDLIIPDSNVASDGKKIISHLIITHPHEDHYSGVQSLLNRYHVQKVILSPFWYETTTNAGYHNILNMLDSPGSDSSFHFLSGYERIYPDGGTFDSFGDKPLLELLGPSNDILKELHLCGKLNTNHLSIMARFTWERFSMVFAGDAQMENWAQYDSEGMLARKCKILRTAHHGSMNGTQWERLEKLSPGTVIVSSDPEGRDKLPDLIGAAIFRKYDTSKSSRKVYLTCRTGTIKLVVSNPASGRFKATSYREEPTKTVPWGEEKPDLPKTDWDQFIKNQLGII